jgi:hypothetical protein
MAHRPAVNPPVPLFLIQGLIAPHPVQPVAQGDRQLLAALERLEQPK